MFAGETIARCHIEVDANVDLLCLEVGLALEKESAFPSLQQQQIYCCDEDPERVNGQMHNLLREAVAGERVTCVGSAP